MINRNVDGPNVPAEIAGEATADSVPTDLRGTADETVEIPAPGQDIEISDAEAVKQLSVDPHDVVLPQAPYEIDNPDADAGGTAG